MNIFTAVPLTKSSVGLDQVDNTSDATKNAATATLTNKTIDGDLNTLLDIPQSAVTGLATALSAKEATANKGVANGYASLDANARVPVSQLPNSIMEYQGVWNASTNTPTLADGTGSAGDVYRVSVAASRDLGSGSIDFQVGDYVIFNGATWEKADTTDAVASVNGYTGNVTLGKADVGLGNVDNTSDATKNSAAVALTNKDLTSATNTFPTSLVTTSATQTLSNKTLTTPVIGQIKDANGNVMFDTSPTANAVNYAQFYNAATGAGVGMRAAGSDANVGFAFQPKGSGWVDIYTSAGQTPTLRGTGADTNVNLNLRTKGTGVVQANSVEVVTVSGTQTLTAKTLTSPTLTTPVLGTPSSGTLTNCTGLPVGGISATGTADATTYLRGDGTWATVSGGGGGGSGDVTSNTTTSVDSEVALFSGTGGKTIKRATGSGLAVLTSGVLSTVTAPTGAVVGTTDTQSLSNKTLTAPTITDFTESVQALGTLTSSATLSLTNGTVITATRTPGTALTFTMPTATAGKSFTVFLRTGSTTSTSTVTFTGVKWATGTPTITSTALRLDIFSFVSDGTNWYGTASQGYTP